MIISWGRTYIFVHIPKTGGTSLAWALETRAMKDDVLIGDTPKAKRRRKRLEALAPRGRLWKHSGLRDIEGVVSQAQMQSMFVFTLVRNPWDRMVSYYAWLRDQRFAHPDVSLARTRSFADFLSDPVVQSRFRTSSTRSYTTDSAGQDHASACIRLEHFEDDARVLWDHLGFSLALPHQNRSQHRTAYEGYYSAQTRDLVADLFMDDIDRFGYQFKT